MNLNEPTDAQPSRNPFRDQEESLADAEVMTAELVRPGPRDADRTPPPRRARRKRLPLILLLLTCVSTFWAGATAWAPTYYLFEWAETGSAMSIRTTIVSHWQDGLLYMACVLAILFTHEMGHFIATLRHHIPASLPFFLPLPISPIGTMGAVIAMDGMRADRKQMFDIGIAGPLAGLVVAVPILLIGIHQLDLTATAHGPFKIDSPLAVRLLMEWVRPHGYESGGAVWFSQLNPYFMAGWVGLVVTGLNMLPVSQLDGGHVVYTLFGKRARWVARGFVVIALIFVAWTSVLSGQPSPWSLMLLLVILMGPDHPPTRNDSARLGWLRTTLGLLSLSIPVLCFPPQIMEFVTN
jgi:membrane-associated protease RseP (regulator of RpoE activity)